MAYLTTTDYNGFIASAIQPDRGKIDLYFQSLYKEHEQDNKVDFYERLNSIILDLETQFQLQKDQYIKGKEDMKEIQKGLLSKGESFSKKTIDSFENLDWNKIPFHYENGKIWRDEKQNSVQVYEFDIRNLLRGLESFRSLLNNNVSIELNDSNKITINWDIKSKNHLYYTLNQFKKIGLINNTYSELAKFVKQNFPVFDEDETRIMEAIEDQKKAPKRGTLETEKIINDIRE
jgi:hypothetical protein